MNKKYLSIISLVILTIIVGIIIYKSGIKKVLVVNPPQTTTTKPTIEDVVTRLENSETAHQDTSTWKEHISSKLGIKFKYPPTLFVFEGQNELYNLYILTIYEDTPDNHYYVDNRNMLDSEAETLNKISISTSPFKGDFVASDVMKDFDSSTKWKEITFKSNQAIASIGTAYMLGDDYPYDGLTIVRNKTLFNFGVPHWLNDLVGNNEKTQIREDFYKILSTLEFLE